MYSLDNKNMIKSIQFPSAVFTANVWSDNVYHLSKEVLFA